MSHVSKPAALCAAIAMLSSATASAAGRCAGGAIGAGLLPGTTELVDQLVSAQHPEALDTALGG